MADLRTNFKDDILSTAEQGTRKFNIVDANGNVLYEGVHLEDISNYLQVGDEYGADEINEQNEAIKNLSSDKLDKTGASTNNTVAYTSADDATVFNSGNLGGQSTYAWSAVSKIATDEKHSSLFNKISTMFKNIRTIAKLIGTTDISAIGSGTLSSAINALKTGAVASITRSGTTFTAKNSAGTQLFTFTQQDNNTTTGTTYAANSLPSNTTFGTNGSIKNVWDAARQYLPTWGTSSYGRGEIKEALSVNTQSAGGTENRVGYVYSGYTNTIPSNCASGIREVYYYNSANVYIKITGVDTSGKFAVWGNCYNGSTWTGWQRL